MSDRDDLLANDQDDKEFDTEGDTEFAEKTIDGDSFVNPNDFDRPEEEAKTLEHEDESVDRLAKHNSLDDEQ